MASEHAIRGWRHASARLDEDAYLFVPIGSTGPARVRWGAVVA